MFHKGSSYCTQLDLDMSLVSKKYVKFNKTVSQISVTLQSVMENSLVSFGVSPFQLILSVSSISDVQGTEIYHCQLVYDPCLCSNFTHRVQIGLCQFSWYIKPLLIHLGYVFSFLAPYLWPKWFHTISKCRFIITTYLPILHVCAINKFMPIFILQLEKNARCRIMCKSGT